jgi:branched-chain amino acid transport system substrate-binding protein
MLTRILLALLCLPLAVAAFAACSDDDDVSGSNDTFRVGALLPLTGALASYGETSKAALEAAVAANGGAIELVIRDTATTPATALEKLQELHADGIRVVIGPYASSEVNAVKQFADANGIVIVSPLSTARSLAIPGDNIYRFTPDDEQQGAAVAALAYADGVRTMVAVTRDDEGNKGLQAAMRAAFEAVDGRVIEGTTYAADQADFQDVVRTLVRAVGSAQDVGIYLTGFGEVGTLFEAIVDAEATALFQVPWYGSDSVALSKELVENAKAAGFAVAAGYPNPILGLAEADRSRWEPVSKDLEAKLGRTPDAFALASHDALNVVLRTLRVTGADAGAQAIGAELVRQAASFQGLTGPTTLNEAGDRTSSNYDFWAVCEAGSGFTWEKVASTTRAGESGIEVQRHEGCR